VSDITKIMKTVHDGIKEHLEKYFEWFLKNLETVDKITIIDEDADSILFDYTTTRTRNRYRYIRVKDVSTGKFAFLSVPSDVQTCIDKNCAA